jgi:K(+)-stimulated pyrophosphate-energized sodium pump
MNEVLSNLIFTAGTSMLALFYVYLRWRQLLSNSGVVDPEMLKISSIIKKATQSFVRLQSLVSGRDIGIIVILLFIANYFGYISIYTPFAVFTGAFFSAFAAYIGMMAACTANAIVASNTKYGILKAFSSAMQGGSVMGFIVVGFGLLDLSIWYAIIYYTNLDLPASEVSGLIVSTVITFAFGASYMAFRARVSGGIFTKSADSSADIVGKGEYKLDEDDPRNPAVIADNAGDNASDIAGMGQDLNESYVGGNAASMEAGLSLFQSSAITFGVMISIATLIKIPLAVSCIGVVASIIGLSIVKSKKADLKSLITSVRRGVYLASIIVIIGSFFLIRFTFDNLNFFWPIVIGILTGNAISFIAEYFTSASNKPTQKLAAKSKDGHASVIIEGHAIGYESAAYTIILVVVGIILSFVLSGGSLENKEVGIYGLSLAAVAMLSILPITLTIDAFGPIADNAQGILEMRRIKGKRAEIANAMDSLGNTTAATGKGQAIGSAAFASLSLIWALDHIVKLSMTKYSLPINVLDPSLDNIYVITGLMLGVAVPFLFVSKLLRAVGDTASKLIKEIKDHIVQIINGTEEPNYQRCVTIATKEAQKQSIFPGVMVIVIPTIIYVFGGPDMIKGFLLSSLAMSFGLAILQSNAGGAWDNAKKYIEAGNFGGKGSLAHEAAITGDMIGDPYKDTSGPSLNILIKLMITYSIMATPVLVNLHFAIFN